MAEQTELYNERVAQLEASGLSHEEAESRCKTQVQVPGCEWTIQTGLAIEGVSKLSSELRWLPSHRNMACASLPRWEEQHTGVYFWESGISVMLVVKMPVYGQASASIEEYIQLLKSW